MKHSILSLIAATLLSAPAFAEAGADPVQTSFERDLVREVSTPAIQYARAEADPLAEIFAAGLEGQFGAMPHALATPHAASSHLKR